jgi:hypothetical protein
MATPVPRTKEESKALNDLAVTLYEASRQAATIRITVEGRDFGEMLETMSKQIMGTVDRA